MDQPAPRDASLRQAISAAGSYVRHRIHNPLQVILAEAQLLAGQGDAAGDTASAAEAISQAAARIVDSIGELEGWSYGELAGSPPPPPETTTSTALTSALASELTVLVRQIDRPASHDRTEALRPRMRRAARLASLWLNGSPTTSTAASMPLGAASIVATPPDPDPSPPAPAMRPAAGEAAGEAADPVVVALLDRVARLEAERHELRTALDGRERQWAHAVHELRNAAQALGGWLGRLHASPAAEEPWFEPVRQTAEALLRRAEETIDAARGVEGPDAFVLERVAVMSVVQEAWSAMAPAMEAKGVRCGVVAAPEAERALVRADHRRAVQILINLLRNAATATPAGGAVALSVELDGEEARVEVCDSGPGLPDGPADRRGFGLAIARELAERMEGTLEAATAHPHGGAAFTLRLRRVQT